VLKVIIVILLIGVLISLISGLGFLFKDSDITGSKRTLIALGIRITLAGTLLLVTSYGLYSGELQLNAPWHGR
jgi:hypothetical protein